MNLNKYYTLPLTLCILLTSCKEEILGPLETGGAPPPAVSDARVENYPGAAKITYSVPDAKNLLYVKAEYFSNGIKRETKSTFYQDFVELKGFGEAKEYEVKLYSVSRSEQMSEPVTVIVHPLQPPVQETFASLALTEDFGGATVSFLNPSQAELNIIMLTTDENGDWVTADILYTKKENGYFSVRGYDTIPRKFGVFVKDRWDNTSDTLVQELTPIFEKHLDRTKFQEVVLPGDQAPAFGWVMPYIWDGVIVNNTNVDKPGFHTSPNGVWPQWFTFSLGVKAKLSRFRYWQRGSWISFTDRNIKKFELWGSNDPAPDGSWESWTLLTAGESSKPSGLPPGQNSQEDLDLIAAGEEFLIPSSAPAVKYIRIKVTETWGGADSFYIMQVAFWGAEQ
jgi:hypothetical protein